MNAVTCRHRHLIILIVFLLLAGIPGAVAAPELSSTGGPGGNITVASYPEGAAVYLNGGFRGITPLEMTGIPPGDYVVNVSMNGYQNETFTTTLFHGSGRQINVNLIAAGAAPTTAATFAVVHGTGSIGVDSNPGGASVKLDGIPVGNTPTGRAALILNSVPDGTHTITVELAGYPAYTETVTVRKNNVVKVEADFVTRTPTIYSVTTIATTDRAEPVPVSPLAAIVAAGFVALVVAFRRQ